MNQSITIASVLPLLSLLLGGGAGVVLVGQLLKKVFGLESSVVVHVMIMATTILMSVAQYVLTYKNLPPELLGITAPAIYGFSQGLYNTAKYLSGFLGQIQTTYNAGKQSLAATPTVAVSTPAPDTTVNVATPENTTTGSFDA